MNPVDAWNAAYSQLEMQLDRATFDTWLRDAAFLDFEADTFVIGVRSVYAREQLSQRLYRTVRRIVSDVMGRMVELRFELHRVQADEDQNGDMPLFRLLAEQQMMPPAPETRPAAEPPLHQLVARPQRPSLPESELNPRFTFDRLIIGNENPLVYPAARAVAERPGMAYSPFMVYGGVGLGKTHLLHAIAHEGRALGKRVIYISSEAFTNDLIDAIRHRTTAMFREKYRTADVLLIDDIQFIVGKDTVQEEIFHTFNTLHANSKQIVLAADRHPSQLDGVVDRLRSRFQAGLVVDVKMPEFETRVAILRMWCSERGITLSRQVCEMLANRARTHLRELESVFNQVVASSQLSSTPVTCDVVDDLLHGYVRPRQHLSLMQVLDITARYHGLDAHDLIGPRRNGVVSQARQIAMYLAREVTTASLPQIGEAFGGRTHSTVLHSCNKIVVDMENDDYLRNTVISIRKMMLEG